MVLKRKRNEPGVDAKNWYKDKYQYVLVQRNILAVTTLVALFAAMAAVAAVTLLTPHKSVEPFVIQIDDKTGIVQRIDPVARQNYTTSEAIDRFFIAQYIRARESYNPTILPFYYDVVRVMSDSYVFIRYRAMQLDDSNPESPAALLKAGGIRSVRFKSVSFIDRAKTNIEENLATRVAQARIILTDVSRQYPTPVDYHNIVTLSYEYATLELNEEERYLNPIGFTVTDYTIEREVVP